MPKLPNAKERVLILGSTGSGKTTLGAWMLSHAPFHKIPYVMIDYKGDELLNSIDRRREIGLNFVPKYPGLYHLRPKPFSDDDAMEDWLQKVWAKQDIGLYVDEALRIPTGRRGAFEGILTQGRALNIPVINLSQRPVDLTRYAFSEANHIFAMRLTDRRDRKSVSEYVPIGPDYDDDLPDYHSVWFRVGDRKPHILGPAPIGDEILETFSERLKPIRKAL